VGGKHKISYVSHKTLEHTCVFAVTTVGLARGVSGVIRLQSRDKFLSRMDKECIVQHEVNRPSFRYQSSMLSVNIHNIEFFYQGD